MSHKATLVVFAALVGACAGHNTASTGASACTLSSRDSAYVGTEPLYRDCAVDRKANLTNSDVRPAGDGLGGPMRPSGTKCYSVELEFVVNIHGVPETNTAHIVRSNDDAFADAWLKVVPTWKYEPAMRGGKPVRQIVDERRSAVSQDVLVARGSNPPSAPPNAGRRVPTC